jgi:outer membrane protein assembly factor BamA
VENRYQNYLNQKYEIGGADRLRGYPTDDPTLRGDDAFVTNVEFRSAGVNILSVECGAALFYDVGGTADELGDIGLRQSAGAGLRFMLPQFNRVVMRADWAFPLSRGYATLPGGLFVTYEQAVSMPGLSAPNVITDAL